MSGKTKRKKGRQKSKAAQVTAAKRAERAASEGTESASESVEYTGGGGMMTRMRGGFQSAVGVGEQKKKSGIMGTLLWIILIAAAVFFVMGQYQ